MLLSAGQRSHGPFSLFVCVQLKSRFQAAQNQIIELRRRVEQMQIQVCVMFLGVHYCFNVITLDTEV